MGIPGRSEVHTYKGRIDTVIQLPGRTYIVELKYAQTVELLETALAEGMEQINRKQYYEGEIRKGRKIWLPRWPLRKDNV